MLGLTVIYNDLLNESTTAPGLPETPPSWGVSHPGNQPKGRHRKKGTHRRRGTNLQHLSGEICWTAHSGGMGRKQVAYVMSAIDWNEGERGALERIVGFVERQVMLYSAGEC